AGAGAHRAHGGGVREDAVPEAEHLVAGGGGAGGSPARARVAALPGVRGGAGFRARARCPLRGNAWSRGRSAPSPSRTRPACGGPQTRLGSRFARRVFAALPRQRTRARKPAPPRTPSGPVTSPPTWRAARAVLRAAG